MARNVKQLLMFQINLLDAYPISGIKDQPIFHGTPRFSTRNLD